MSPPDYPTYVDDSGEVLPKVRWKEQIPDEEFIDGWPEEAAIERQIQEYMEVRQCLACFLEDEIAGGEGDGTIEIDDYLANNKENVEASKKNSIGSMSREELISFIDTELAKSVGNTTATLSGSAGSVTGQQVTFSPTTSASTHTINTNTTNTTPVDASAEHGQFEPEERADLSRPILTPLDASTTEVVDLARFKKRVLPYADVHYKGRILKFTKDLASAVKDNFHKKPFEQVVVNHVNDKNEHNDDPLKVMGEVKDFQVEDDGLYAVIEANDKGTRYLTEENPNVGCSVRFFPMYKRAWDQQEFGPCVEHVAITPQPHITGLGPWQTIGELSREVSDSGETADAFKEGVDLSRETFVVSEVNQEGAEETVSDEEKREAAQDEQERSELSGQEAGAQEGQEDSGAPDAGAEAAESVRQEEDRKDSEGGEQVAMSEEQANQILEMSRKLEAAEAALSATRQRERRLAIRHKIETEFPGIASFARDAAVEIMLSADGGEKEAFELSATGEAVLSEDTIAQPVKQLLEACSAKVEMSGEQGTTRVPDQQRKDEMSQAKAKHDADYLAYLKLAGNAAEAELAGQNGSQG